MNIPAAIELAYSDLFRQSADIGEGTIIRAYQTLSDEPEIQTEGQKVFPVISIKASPAVTDDQWTYRSDVEILCATFVDDDKNHTTMRDLYGAVESSLYLLHDQFMAGATGTQYDLFTARLTQEIGADFHFGGLTFDAGLSPYEEGNYNIIGLLVSVHFARP